MSAGSSRGAGVVAAALVLGATLAGPIVAPPAAQAVECSVKPGGPDPGRVPWAQQRLNIADVWPITQGANVRVAVVDSGVDRQQPQMAQVHYAGGARVVPGGTGPTDTTDCVGHGTGVAGIIAAPKVQGVGFTGVAPGAMIIPIEVTNNDQGIPAETIAKGIDNAIDKHAQVINVSIYTTSDVPELRDAVARAERAGIVVVAAASEGQSQSLPGYPAAYSTQNSNVIAVGMTDTQDNVADGSGTGAYIDLVAPGQDVEAPQPGPSLRSGYRSWEGTSFATPYVTGVVALVLATHPSLTPAQVRNRLEATADPPPGVTVPSTRYGYGIVNPYLAVTTIRNDSKLAGAPTEAAAVPPVPPKAPADRHLQHLALAVGTILLGLAVLGGLTAAVIRRGSWFGRAGTASASGEEQVRQLTDVS